MTLLETLHNAAARFRPRHPQAPANRFVFGFVPSDAAPLSISISRDAAYVEPGIRDAEYLICGTSAKLEALFDPRRADRATIAAQLDMRPAYPFNNYLLSILLNGLDLIIPDLDYAAKRVDGTFPFPPRYPAAENRFRLQHDEPAPIPPYERNQLPQLVADDHPVWVAMYHRAWQLAFRNLRQPEAGSGFIASFIDAAFNPNTFLWDSCFMMRFGRYGRRVFPFMGTLDNFYAKQHDDGFICREINTYSGNDVFQSLDPRSTGPNILAWTELAYFDHTGDLDRLRAVFPVLIAYHGWWKSWRTHPDGSYWTSGWGSGMDNQTRVPDSEYHHRHYAWIDATMQMALDCEALLTIARWIGRNEFTDELTRERDYLIAYINDHMWDDERGFYCDRAPDGTLSPIHSIAAYWGLLSDAIPSHRAARLIAHLDDPTRFKRPHRVPTLSADSADYNPYGGYWMGGVWSPTNYMVLRGLTHRGEHALAHEIALNHVEQVTAVFEQTGTLFENYAPEHSQPGTPAGRDFVGWTGVSAITIPLEYLVGVRVSRGGGRVDWDIRLTERHGVFRLPLRATNTVDLICDARPSPAAPPVLTVRTAEPLQLHIHSENQTHSVDMQAGQHHLRFSPTK